MLEMLDGSGNEYVLLENDQGVGSLLITLITIGDDECGGWEFGDCSGWGVEVRLQAARVFGGANISSARQKAKAPSWNCRHLRKGNKTANKWSSP
jgi:hypothetical protein